MDDSQQSRKRQRTSADGARVETGAERQAGATSSAAFAAAAGSSGSKPKYLASSPSGGAVEEPRVGTNYQATRLPESNTFAPPKGAAAAAAASTSGGRPVSSLPALSPVEGTCVWQGHRMRAADAIKLDAYLRSVEMLFYASSEHYDEEKALEVLHRCNYDTVQALELLQPWARVEEDDDNARDGTGEKKEFESDDACAVCGDGGDLIICDAKGCKRVYHAVCAELAEIPSGQWECAVHFCHTCGQRVNDANSVRCSSCPTSFCAAHIPAYARSAHQIKHVDFKCPRCAGSRDSSTSDRRGFLTQLMAALNKTEVPTTGRPAEYHSAPINLKELYREITVRGGLEEVLTTTAWREIQRLFFHPIAQSKPSQRVTQK